MRCKKIIVILFFIIFFIPIIIHADSNIVGDVDGDGYVKSNDYILVRKHILKNPVLTGDKLTRANVDGKNGVNSADYIAIRKIIIGGGSPATPTPAPTPTPTPTPAPTATPTSKPTATPAPIAVTGVSLNKSSITLDVGKTDTLIATISPSNANNKNITFSSSNTSVATINNGTVTAISAGTATITVTTSDGNKTAKCTVTVNRPKKNPIIPSSATIKYESSTLKYYLQNNNGYYLTYIWMDDPYNQIKKLDANVAAYGSVMTDDELASGNKKLNITSLGEMVKRYLEKGLIANNKGLIAFNASGFWLNGSWVPPTPYYDHRSDSWLVVTEGKITRYRPEDAILSNFDPRVIGITSSGDLKIYPITQNKDISVPKGIYNSIIADGVKNTWSFYPLLIENGKNVMWDDNKTAMRQAICQVDSNNYIMFTSKYKTNYKRLFVATTLYNLGCQTAFNLDGGGSISITYKKPNEQTKKYLCHNTDSGGCRSMVEGIYFVEK